MAEGMQAGEKCNRDGCEGVMEIQQTIGADVGKSEESNFSLYSEMVCPECEWSSPICGVLG